MKKVVLVVAAFAALSFSACKSGNKSTSGQDSTATQNMVNEAMDSVKSMPAPADTSHMMDTTKHM